MDNFQIETAQNVRIQQNVASLGDRLLAYLVDALIIIAYELMMLFVMVALLETIQNETWLLLLVFGLPPFLYHLLFEIFWNGRSLGKAALKIRVVKIDGSTPSFSAYIIRWLLRFIDITLCSGSIAVVTILLNGKGQRLGDLAAKTTVISEKEQISLHQTLLVDLPENYQPEYPQVRVFSDREIQQIKQMYRKAKFDSNHAVILSLSKRIAEVMEVEPKERPLAFVEKVITDYNFYTQQ
ncbi:RDD family protein [Mesonia maritima]|uniref:RDD family membrane protein YckC n=1 Tax=Mesonia maritima TaxID=1793873 RepID=A0ABU1K5G7_9FLAO|nr:RDD family protein [Mesonia maritima]MDR6300860.1 putative RDD family membrane protein YckC [Mesonia maritima]